MAASIAYVGNTNDLELTGLKSDAEDTYLNDATITVTVKDAAGNSVAGEEWPATMTYVDGSNGDYVLGLTYLLELVGGAKYTAVIDADASDTSAERYGHWEFPFTAQVRKK